MLDDDILEHFRARAEAQGMGYQTMINTLLKNLTRSLPITKKLTRKKYPS
jgi:uncharacterized protein (DUF4415 family)